MTGKRLIRVLGLLAFIAVATAGWGAEAGWRRRASGSHGSYGSSGSHGSHGSYGGVYTYRVYGSYGGCW